MSHNIVGWGGGTVKREGTRGGPSRPSLPSIDVAQCKRKEEETPRGNGSAGKRGMKEGNRGRVLTIRKGVVTSPGKRERQRGLEQSEKDSHS